MEQIEVSTKAHGELREITREVRAIVARAKIASGIVRVFVPHTTAGLTINEHADPDVKTDILRALDELIPWDASYYRHSEGNSAAHIKASLMGFSTAVMIENGELALGTWQGIFLCEFDGPRTRQVWVQVEGK